MNNWEKNKIEDVCDFIGGSQPPKSTFINIPKVGYTRLVQTRDFKTDKFPTYIKTNSTTKFFCKEDIIIGRYGPPIFQIFRGVLEGAYNVALMKAAPKENITTAFLYYFLIQKEVFEYVDKLSARTGGQTGVDLASLYKYPIRLPDITTQQKIASVLTVLDSKIELNNRINTELEAMAKTLYDYWFVQFDFPDVNGKPYKTSGGKMVWNEELKREIPEGWEILDLEKVENNIVTGKTPSTTNSNFYNGNIPFITIGDVRGNMHIVSTVQKLTKDGANQQTNKFIPKGAICVTCIASPGLVGFATEDSQTNQQLNSVVCKNFENRYYLYFYLTDYFKYSSAKTGNTFANMNKGDFASIKVIKPYTDILICISNILDSAIEKILNNSLENQKLTELRDWLLPMLMNGQVKVN